MRTEQPAKPVPPPNLWRSWPATTEAVCTAQHKAQTNEPFTAEDLAAYLWWATELPTAYVVYLSSGEWGLACNPLPGTAGETEQADKTVHYRHTRQLCDRRGPWFAALGEVAMRDLIDRLGNSNDKETARHAAGWMTYRQEDGTVWAGDKARMDVRKLRERLAGIGALPMPTTTRHADPQDSETRRRVVEELKARPAVADVDAFMGDEVRI